MKKLMMIAAIAASTSVLPNTVNAQGNVSFTSIDQSTFNSYSNSIYVLFIATVNTGGSLTLWTPTGGSHTASLGMQSAYQTSIGLSDSGGTLTLSGTIQNGVGGATGASASTSISSLTPVLGFAMGVSSPGSPTFTTSISDWTVTGVDQPNGPSTTGSTFSGMLATLGSSTATFGSGFSANTTLDSGSRITIVGLSNVAPVPEPSTTALIGGAAALMFVMNMRKRRA